MKAPTGTTATQDGEATINLKELTRILKRSGPAEQKLAQFTRRINRHTPCKLPNLQISDDGFDFANWKTIDLED